MDPWLSQLPLMNEAHSEIDFLKAMKVLLAEVQAFASQLLFGLDCIQLHKARYRQELFHHPVLDETLYFDRIESQKYSDFQKRS